MAALNHIKNPLISRLRLLTDLSDESLAKLGGTCATTQAFPAHADLVEEGRGADTIHVVLEGWCCRYRMLADGRRQLPALLLPGDICDLDSLLLKQVHFGVATLTPCTVAVIRREELRRLMDSDKAIRDVLWWLLSVENAIATEWVVGLGQRSTDERLAHLMCELLVRLSMVESAHENSFHFPLTQQELGDVLGVSTVHVNRTLQSLRSRGLLKSEGRNLVIEDWDALTTRGEFAPAYLHPEGLRTPRIGLLQQPDSLSA